MFNYMFPQIFYKEKKGMSDNLIDAVKNNDLDFIKIYNETSILHEMEYSEMLDLACELNRIEIFEYLYKIHIKKNNYKLLEKCCINGNIEIIKFIEDCNFDIVCDYKIFFFIACKYNHINLMKYFAEKMVKLTMIEIFDLIRTEHSNKVLSHDLIDYLLELLKESLIN